MRVAGGAWEEGCEGWAEMARWRRADSPSAAAPRGGRAPPAGVPQEPDGGARRGCSMPPPPRPGDHDGRDPPLCAASSSTLHPSPGRHGALDPPAARARRGTHTARSSPGADPSALAGGLRTGGAGQLERRIEELERRLGGARAGARAGGAGGAGGAEGGGAGYAGPREWSSPLCVPTPRRARPAPHRSALRGEEGAAAAGCAAVRTLTARCARRTPPLRPPPARPAGALLLSGVDLSVGGPLDSALKRWRAREEARSSRLGGIQAASPLTAPRTPLSSLLR